MISDLKQDHTRSSIHFLAAVLAMGIYGGQVCPLIETLSLGQWFAEIAAVFSIIFLIRMVLIRGVVAQAPLAGQVTRQFSLELSLFLGAGFLISLVNSLLYGFPNIESGLKMVLGTATLGFFMAVDLGLERERFLGQHLSSQGAELMVDKQFFPMTWKFSLVAAIVSVTVSAVVLMVVLKDLGWMEDQDTIDLKSARIAVIKEILFVTLIFLAHIFNLILSYAKNLNLALNRENNALIDVANGDLDAHVTVSTNDEFGVMARYTNQMITMLRKNTREIRQTRDTTIMALAGLAETRDNETGAHILRTQNYVRALARQLASHPRFESTLDEEFINLVYKSAPLHDIGKVGIPDNILLKPGRLTDDEFDIMKQHTVLGQEALDRAAANLEENNFLKTAREIALSHHERWDGAGYPQGLKGDTIPVAARLMAVADVYDALISKRVYKEAFSHDKAKSIIKEGKGTHFDPDVLDAFLAVETEFTAIAAKYADHH